MVHDLAAQRGLLLGSPFAEPLARLEAQLAVGHKPLEVRRWAGAAVDVWQHGFVDRKREVGADEVGVLERSKYCKPAAERGLDDGVDRFGVADTALDQ